MSADNGSETSLTWRPGMRLANYLLLRELARGGMGEIWLARQRQAAGIERNVVIKRLITSGDEDAGFVNLFLDEARIASQLQHPNIVQVFDFAEHGGSYYLVMEFLPGETLSRVVRAAFRTQTELSPALCAHVIAEAAAGLGYAHQRKGNDGQPLNIVHRDVSPQNIHLTYDGHVKVLDFGIAHAEGRISRTRSGIVRGKLAYMAPEHAEGLKVTARADVFSLGVVLFEMLTRTRLYGDADEVTILSRLASHPRYPGPRELEPRVPPELDGIVRRAMSVDAAQRHADGRELSGELNRWLREAQQEAPRVDFLMQGLFAERIASWANLEAMGPAELGADLPSPSSNPTMPGRSRRSREAPPRRRALLFAAAGLATVIIGASLAWALWEGPAKLQVSSDPAGATLLLDGQPCTPCDREVPAGTHVLEASLAGYRPVSQVLRLSPGERRASVIALAPLPAPAAVADAGVVTADAGLAPPRPGPDAGGGANATAAVKRRGRLTLDTTPWTKVFLGKTLLGETPLIEANVPAGPLQLRLVNELERIDQVVEVDVAAGQTTVKKLSL